MLGFLTVRLDLIVFTLFVVSLAIFTMTEILPGDVATKMLGQYATEQNVKNLHEKLGLDRSAPVRYLSWIIGWPKSQGALFRTSDGAATWKQVNAGTIVTRTSFASSKLG